MQPDVRLGDIIRERRQDRGLSLRDLSQVTGIHPSYIGRIEQGLLKRPAPDYVQLLGQALDLPVADLFVLAGYQGAGTLPSLRPYLRAKYGPLPDSALIEVEAYLQRASGMAQTEGPVDGEDEQPEQ